MPKGKNKRKKASGNILGSQNSSILDFFSQTNKEHTDKAKKTTKHEQSFSNLVSFSSSFDHSQGNDSTIEEMNGVSSNTQESAFDIAFGTQNSHAWSEVISEIGDSDLTAPFLFDLDKSNIKSATQTESVISSFSDNSQPMLRAEDFPFNDISENQEFKRESSVNSFVSSLGSPVLGTLSFEDDVAESVASGFLTQEPLPLSPPVYPVDNAEPSTNSNNDSALLPFSDFKFIIPTSTASMKSIAKKVPKPVAQRMKKEGLTDVALRTILKETELHEQWEDAINAQCLYFVAKYGNIAKVCKEAESEAVLFWIIDSWIEGNLIFAWCMLMEEEEIEDWISGKEDQESVEGSTCLVCNDQDGNNAIKSCPDNDMLAMMDDELAGSEQKFLFAFSLAYIKSRKYAKKFIEEERVVAVWPDAWSEMHITLPIIGHCIANLTSRFKADSIY